MYISFILDVYTLRLKLKYQNTEYLSDTFHIIFKPTLHSSGN